MTQLGFNVQPAQQPNQPAQQPNQVFYTACAPANRGPSSRRGRGYYNNRSNNTNNQNNRNSGSTAGNNNRFAWASNQNIVYGSCNRCGIGHVPSQFPNCDPTTIRPPRQTPQANFTDYHSHASSSWLPDTGANSHVAPNLSGFDSSEPYYGEDTLHLVMEKVFLFFILLLHLLTHQIKPFQ